MQILTELGKGTTVHLYLPRTHTDPPGSVAEPSHDRAEVPLGHGERVLVVEDEPSVRELTVELLRDLGYRTSEASDGAEALTLLSKEQDTVLLFTDVVLPRGMSGAELAREAQAHRPSLHVLFTSGYTREKIAHDDRLDPYVELMEKPFSKVTLARKIHAALSSVSEPLNLGDR